MKSTSNKLKAINTSNTNANSSNKKEMSNNKSRKKQNNLSSNSAYIESIKPIHTKGEDEEEDAGGDGVGDDGIDEIVEDDNDDDLDEVSPFRDPPFGCVRLRPSQFHNIPGICGGYVASSSF